MKALILAAGFGTRLLPHTAKRPKPLFPIAGIPILQLTLSALIRSGFTEIIVNSHHLNDQMKDFIAANRFPISVTIRVEPEILDTGGAVKNVRDFMGDDPFMVINSDIVTNIDLKAVWEFHLKGTWPVTLVLHHDPRFNLVGVNKDGFVTRFFTRGQELKPAEDTDVLAFTGIQVLSPDVFDRMPDEKTFSSIDFYGNLAKQGPLVKANIQNQPYWQDIGTLDSYRSTNLFFTAHSAFDTTPDHPELTNYTETIAITPLSGDGSDRRWYRATKKTESVIIADHGLHEPDPDAVGEVDAFVSIGNHLFSKGIPVPKIIQNDRFSGLVVLEDLGETHFQKIILGLKKKEAILDWYKKVCHHIFNLFLEGIKGFDPRWSFQTESYSREVILEKECRYFMEAFIQGYLKKAHRFDEFKAEFGFIADVILENPVSGFIHRDMQSRNIMVKNNQPYFIDFQGGRKGPVQYDLASLFIDPYVNLDPDIIETLLKHCAARFNQFTGVDPDAFIRQYRYCSITRNLQILGAFSFLTRVKKKPFFEAFIPCAINRLKSGIEFIHSGEINKLKQMIRNL